MAGLGRRDDVRLYVKLPAWFTMPTPIGEYNPDWNIVMDDPEGEGKLALYLVRETKPTSHLAELRPDERQKLRCGARGTLPRRSA